MEWAVKTPWGHQILKLNSYSHYDIKASVSHKKGTFVKKVREINVPCFPLPIETVIQ
jgi:hypothetical protein